MLHEPLFRILAAGLATAGVVSFALRVGSSHSSMLFAGVHGVVLLKLSNLPVCAVLLHFHTHLNGVVSSLLLKDCVEFSQSVAPA